MRVLFRTGPIRVIGVERRVVVGPRAGVTVRRRNDVQNRVSDVPNVGHLFFEMMRKHDTSISVS